MSKFSLGQVVITRGIADKMQESSNFTDFVNKSLTRYSECDWGDTCESDAETNNCAVKGDDRILAVYKNDTDTIWIITEWDRSCTTVLFPEEY